MARACSWEGAAVTHWLESFAFDDPWWDLRGADATDREQRNAMQAELTRELHIDHDLAGRVREVVARSTAQDDVVVSLDRDEAAIVHLTWTKSPPDRPPYPRTRIVSNGNALAAEIAARE